MDQYCSELKQTMLTMIAVITMVVLCSVAFFGWVIVTSLEEFTSKLSNRLDHSDEMQKKILKLLTKDAGLSCFLSSLIIKVSELSKTKLSDQRILFLNKLAKRLPMDTDPMIDIIEDNVSIYWPNKLYIWISKEDTIDITYTCGTLTRICKFDTLKDEAIDTIVDYYQKTVG